MYVRFILLLSFHLHLGLANGPFPSALPIIFSTYFSPVITHATCLAHLILLDLITPNRCGEEL